MVATMLPLAAAITVVTTGNSHTAVILSKLWSWRVNLTIGSPMQMISEMAASIHHRTQVKVANLGPQAGVADSAHMLMIVAKPIGNVPTKND